MRHIIAIDLGATNLRIGIVDSDLNVIKVVREKTTKSDNSLLYSQIKRMLSSILLDLPAEVTSLTSVGVSACGYVQDDYIIKLPNLRIENFDLKKLIETDFPKLKVRIANDANAASYTESLYGAAKDVETSFFITISSGIGGCLVYKRQLVDLPFEIGHMCLTYNHKFYELEHLLSGNGIIFLAKLNDLEITNAGQLFDLYKAGDIKAHKVYEDWIKNLGITIANFQMMFSTDVIILSGGVMKSSHIFEADLLAVASALLAPMAVKPIIFKHSEFDQDAGLIGGAGLALKR